MNDAMGRLESARRDFELVQQVDAGTLPVREYVTKLYGTACWADAWAAYRVYLQHGGQMTREMFFRAFKEML